LQFGQSRSFPPIWTIICIGLTCSLGKFEISAIDICYTLCTWPN
jgi:hypothetical protein